jgi:RNA polymerase sigma factor (sigma-70 family)
MNVKKHRYVGADINYESKTWKDEIVMSYMPLATKMARTHYTRFGERDALQIACYGLVRAAEKFNPTLGVFASYAETWIRWSFQEAAIAATIVHVPTRKSKEMYAEYIASEPSRESLYSPFEIIRLDDCSESGTELYFDNDDISDQRESLSYLSVINDATSNCIDTPEDKFERFELWTSIVEVLSHIPQSQCEVMIYLYGLDGSHPATQVECAETLKIHRNTVKEYHDRALTALRARLTTQK